MCVYMWINRKIRRKKSHSESQTIIVFLLSSCERGKYFLCCVGFFFFFFFAYTIHEWPKLIWGKISELYQQQPSNQTQFVVFDQMYDFSISKNLIYCSKINEYKCTLTVQ